MARRRGNRPRPAPRYPRSARLNQLLRQILGEEMAVIEDDRLADVAIVDVEVDNELAVARVYVSSLLGAHDDERIVSVVQEHRGRLRSAVAQQARIKRTPELVFVADPGVRSGERVETILRSLDLPPEDAAGSDDVDPVDGETD
ncbi:MAG: 30S ribosome-binding factor RbfA [Actinomycetia bacterium]|nr:30S ribosome-binding factor RbfA [Actinomycetes bacterium]MCP3909369.1 30S ribosome-binding factor RbfA [Actinomycetes bacterium]MCP4087628.1 30S ribosome-binding factor RbfA [Actinomycetes bacterium]